MGGKLNILFWGRYFTYLGVKMHVYSKRRTKNYKGSTQIFEFAGNFQMSLCNLKCNKNRAKIGLIGETLENCLQLFGMIGVFKFGMIEVPH